MRAIITALSVLIRGQRVVVVALAMAPLLLVTLCCSPAFVVQPFLPGGTARMIKMITKLISWTKIILISSQGLPEAKESVPRPTQKD